MGPDKMLVNGRKTISYFRKNGLKHTYYAVKERLSKDHKDHYVYAAPTKEELQAQKEELQVWKEELQARKDGLEAETQPYPLVSLVVPTYETKEEYLVELMDSVFSQSYDYFELILADASSSETVKNCVQSYINAKKIEEQKLLYIKLDANAGISENTNAGMAHAKGQYVCLLDHDDLLTEDALYHMVKTAVKAGMPEVLYSDEDKTNSAGTEYYDVNDKYKFNYDLILTNNYICHLMMIRRDVLDRVKERKTYDGAQDYDLVLQIIGLLSGQGVKITELGEHIVHVPKVLYHWRCHEQSTAQNVDSKMYAYEAGKNALTDYWQTCGKQFKVKHSLHLGFYETEYEEDIFAVRPELGAVVGRVLDKKGCMTDCIADEDGNYLYTGLHKEFAGRLNRFALRQDVAYGDLRCMKLAGKLWDAAEEILGIPYLVSETTGLFDYDRYLKEYSEKYGKIPEADSMTKQLFEMIREEDLLVMYDPGISMTVQ